MKPEACEPAPVSWAPEVRVEGVWSRNGLRFATREEAERSASALFMRWFLVTDSRATPATEPVNYRLAEDGSPVRLPDLVLAGAS